MWISDHFNESVQRFFEILNWFHPRKWIKQTSCLKLVWFILVYSVYFNDWVLNWFLTAWTYRQINQTNYLESVCLISVHFCPFQWINSKISVIILWIDSLKWTVWTHPHKCLIELVVNVFNFNESNQRFILDRLLNWFFDSNKL